MKPATSMVGSKESKLAMAAVTTEQLAALLRHDIEMPKALEFVQFNPASLSARLNDSDLQREASAPSQSVRQEHGQGSLFPMLQHAVSLSSVTEKMVALQSAAVTYRSLAKMRHAKVRNWVHRLAMGLWGGMLVLGVGLSVFWPIAELLYDLAKPGGIR